MSNAQTIVEQAISRSGGGAALARELNLKRQAVYQWARVPVAHVLDVERLTGIPRHELRPDVYPDPTEQRESA